MLGQGNNTTTHIVAPACDSNMTNVQWNFVAGLRLFTCTATFWLSLVLLAVFLAKRMLQTPFNIYLINLLVANLLYLALSSFHGVIQWIKANWWGGFWLCNIYKYGIITPSACMIWTEVLITANRVWAVTFPHSYRFLHTRRLAVGTCVAMWMVVHVVCVPFLVMDAWWYSLPGEINGCHINVDPQAVYSQVIEISMADLPIILIMVTYPYLLWKTIMRKRPNNLKSIKPKTREYTFPTSLPASGNWRTFSDENRTSFIVLTWLTISVVVCLTPMTLVMLAGRFVNHDVPVAFYRAAIWLQELQATADGVIIFVIVKDLRDAMLEE
ncbi:proteinase-activated receptor 3-like [Paramacrobiotus metropolitanus]|uniref:proteinase-activated receptor 3-like n=1 Tax=Paramacrobiotus metropolitanus TaxID=2943436 RepID=UPI002445EF78|nr:proteinase-activated receptor 3-like [Paramacrobiotus metropolitanus]